MKYYKQQQYNPIEQQMIDSEYIKGKKEEKEGEQKNEKNE